MLRRAETGADRESHLMCEARGELQPYVVQRKYCTVAETELCSQCVNRNRHKDKIRRQTCENDTVMSVSADQKPNG
jgi:hypothetical protein